MLARILFLFFLTMAGTVAVAQNNDVPIATRDVVQALNQAGWQSKEEGLDLMQAITQSGLVVTAYRISPERFSFEIVQQETQEGSRARAIGESVGAVITINGGFFAARESGNLYPVGYLRKNGKVHSKGWHDAGGLIEFRKDGPTLSPTHQGIGEGAFDVLQTKPMILEPGAKWAMGSNRGIEKPRSLFCRKTNGDIIVVVITRIGLSLYEAGWVLRSKADGGFFECDSAIALDGGRSTQVWYADDQAYSHAGLTTVQNFIVVRPKLN